MNDTLQEPCLLIADIGQHSLLAHWCDPFLSFEEATLERISAEPLIALAPGDAKYLEHCRSIIEMKREGRLPNTKIALVTYKGRNIWSPDYDDHVAAWVVHARSEFEVLKSSNTVFVPLCLSRPRSGPDEGFAFLGGRKYRCFDPAVKALAELGLPGVLVSDRAPQEDYPPTRMIRHRIPKKDYIDLMHRARIVLVPLQQRPESHGHMDVVTAIRFGKPLVVTRHASCEDYVFEGVNGTFAADNSVESWKTAIGDAWERADELAEGARNLAPTHSAEQYVVHIRKLLSGILSGEVLGQL